MLEELLKLIDMPREASARVLEEAGSYDFGAVRESILALTDNRRYREEAMPALREAFGKNAPDGDPLGYRMLTAHLLAADESRQNGEWKDFPEEIYADTMKCFSRFVREHKVSYGEYGFDRAFWTPRQLSCVLRRFGCLEYEIVDRLSDSELPEERRAALPDVPEGGTKEIHLHIPSDALLTDETIRSSVKQARAFMDERHPECADYLWMCCSWLLSPELAKLLPENSHIRCFQSYFEPIAFYPDAEGFYGWCFKVRSADGGRPDPADWPENTSLQRAVKKHILAGGKIGEASGALKI